MANSGVWYTFKIEYIRYIIVINGVIYKILNFADNTEIVRNYYIFNGNEG